MIPPIITLISSFLINWLVIKYFDLHCHISADHDLNGIQKFHTSPVPRVGGISIIIGLLCGIATNAIEESKAAGFQALLITSAIPVFLAGLAEDLTKNISPNTRLSAAMMSAILCGAFLGGWLNHLNIPGLDYLMAFGFFSVLVTCFAITGLTHSFNLIDGYNGLSGTVALIILCGIAIVANQVGDDALTATTLLIGAAIFGFLIWNYPFGLIFLGDGGAYLIGFLVGEMSVLLVVRNEQVSPFFPLLLALYPIYETSFTIFRRIIIEKTQATKPDASHLHQLIYQYLIKRMANKNSIGAINSTTSVFLWIITLTSAIPATLFWGNIKILVFFIMLFLTSYTLIYFILYKNINQIFNKT